MGLIPGTSLAIYIGINLSRFAQIIEGKKNSIGVAELIGFSIGFVGVMIFTRVLIKESKKRLERLV